MIGYKQNPKPEGCCEPQAQPDSTAAEWDLHFDPKLTRSLARLSSEVYLLEAVPGEESMRLQSICSDIEVVAGADLIGTVVSVRDPVTQANRLRGIHLIHLTQVNVS